MDHPVQHPVQHPAQHPAQHDRPTLSVVPTPPRGSRRRRAAVLALLGAVLALGGAGAATVSGAAASPAPSAVTAAPSTGSSAASSAASSTGSSAGSSAGSSRPIIVRVEGTARGGFSLFYADGDSLYPPTLSESMAECGEYDTRVAVVRCRTEVRTWYRDLGDLKRSLAWVQANG